MFRPQRLIHLMGIGMALVAWAAIGVGAAMASDGTAPEPAVEGYEALGQDDAIGYLLVLGEEALSQERYSEAIKLFSEVLRHDWNYPRAYDLLQDTRTQRADMMRRWEWRGRRARKQGEWPQAVWYFEQVLAEDSTRQDMRWFLRNSQRRQGAEKLVRQGLEKYINEDYAGAQLDFEQALALDSTDEAGRLYRDQAAQKIAHTSSLADLQADPDAWANYRAALLAFRAEDLAEARRLWTAILTTYPGNESVLSNLEQITRRLGGEAVAAHDE